MIDVVLFGWLVATLTSGLTVVLVITALASVAYVAFELAGPGSTGRRIGIAAALIALGVSLVGLRLAGPASNGGDALAAVGLSLAFAAAAGAVANCAWARLGHTGRALRALRAQRREARALERRTSAAESEAESLRLRDGDDCLRAALDEAESSVRDLRAAREALVGLRRKLTEKLDALDGSDRALLEECARARDDATTKLDLAERILEEAEAALFRLRCNHPIRLLVRRRPPSELIDPSGGAPAGAEARTARAEETISAFLAEVEDARVRLEALDPARPGALDADDDDDALTLARGEIEAMRGAYAAVLSRLQLVRMRLASGSEAEALARAAGELSARTRGAELDESEVAELVAEVARAEAGSRAVVSGDTSARALVLALARSAAALDRSDAGSLRELCGAVREIG